MDRGLRLGAWFGLGFLVFYLLFLGGGWVGIYATQIRMVSAVLCAVALGAWALAASRDPRWLPTSQLMPAFAVALGAFAVGLVLSRNPRLGAEYLAWSIVLVALYLLLVRLLANPWFRPRVMSVFVFVTALHGLAYVAQNVIEWVAWWDVVGAITTPPLRPRFASLLLGNPSAVMTVQLLLTLPCVAWIGWSRGGRRLASALLILLAAFAVFVSGSRSGWLAVAITIAVLIAIAALRPGSRGAIVHRIRSPRARLAATAALAVGAALALAFSPAVLFRAAGGGENLRLTFFATAVRMFEDEPIHGVGPGMWPVLRATYTQPPEPNQHISHAHNVPLHTLAEFGLIGVLAGAVAILVLLRLVQRGARHTDPLVRRMAWTALAAAVYFAAHQLLDFYANMPAALAAFVVPVAFVDGALAAGDRANPRRRPIAGLIGVLTAIALGGLIVAEGHAATHDRAVSLANAGRWEAADPPARAAVASDPAIPAYQFTLATVARRNGDSAAAYVAYERAAQADGFASAWLGVAVEQQERGLAEQARESLGRALRLGAPASVLVGAADVRLRLGDHEEAVELLAAVVVANPSLVVDPLWTSDPRLAPIAQRVLTAARERATGGQAVMLELEAGDVEAARARLANVDEPTKSWLEMVVRGWSGEASALRAIADRALDRPVETEGPVWGAILADHLGDGDRATDFRRWADTVNGLASIGSQRASFARPESAASDLVSPGTAIYGHYTYRRPVVDAQVPAGLIQLEWK